MKKLTLTTVVLFILTVSAFSQRVKKDSSGVYVPVSTRSIKDSVKVGDIKLKDGFSYPLFSYKGSDSVFYWKKSKAGKMYRQYVKIEN